MADRGAARRRRSPCSTTARRGRAAAPTSSRRRPRRSAPPCCAMSSAPATRTSARSSAPFRRMSMRSTPPSGHPTRRCIVKQLPDVGLTVPMMGPDGQFEPVDYIQASAGGAEGNYVSFLVPDMKQGALRAGLRQGVRGEIRRRSARMVRWPTRRRTSCSTRSRRWASRTAPRSATPCAATKDYQGMLGNAVTFNDKGDVDTPDHLHLPGEGSGFRPGQDAESGKLSSSSPTRVTSVHDVARSPRAAAARCAD